MFIQNLLLLMYKQYPRNTKIEIDFLNLQHTWFTNQSVEPLPGNPSTEIFKLISVLRSLFWTMYVVIRVTLSFLVALVSAPYVRLHSAVVTYCNTTYLVVHSTGVSSMCRTKYLTAKLHLFASLTAALISKNDVEHFLKIGRTYSVMYIF